LIEKMSMEKDMETQHKIIIGDSRKMSEIPNVSIHLVVTSPPYWQLKDYGNGNQIGFNDNYEQYINNLNLVWNECHRVLHQGCRLCINIGDQFARSVYYGRYKVIPIRTEIIKFCESAGFDYMGAIIWQKVTTTNTTGGATVMGSFPYPRNGILKIDYEFILIFKKYGNPPNVSKEIKEQSKLSQEEWNQYFTGHWNFPGERQDKHLAMFPEELPHRLIKMFSFIGDTVLDPFLGSGTTTLAARNLNRNSISYEINEEFLPTIQEKLGQNQKALFQNANIDFIKQQASGTSYDKEIMTLPYIFKDPIKFDKKVDPRKLKFGSKVDNSPSNRETFFTVKEVVSPELVVLSNGLQVGLLGVKNKPGKVEDAIRFLRNKVRGQRVFMKFDDVKHNKNNILLCYLYLRNKTFINAHLVKNGLVDVDTVYDYKYRQKFVDIQRQRDGALI
jgi:DNA modification methylase